MKELNNLSNKFIADKKRFILQPRKRLKQWLTNNGYEQLFIAKATGLSPQFICDILKGRRPFTKSFCYKIGKATNTCPYEWWTRHCFWDFCEFIEEKNMEKEK